MVLDYLIQNTNITRNGIASAAKAFCTRDWTFEQTHTIKRIGPNDTDDLIWMFGKIHGLENIALLSDEQLENIQDPITLQRAINNLHKPMAHASSFEEVLAKTNESLKRYKEEVNKFSWYPSDK